MGQERVAAAPPQRVRWRDATDTAGPHAKGAARAIVQRLSRVPICTERAASGRAGCGGQGRSVVDCRAVDWRPCMHAWLSQQRDPPASALFLQPRRHTPLACRHARTQDSSSPFTDLGERRASR
eukprot:366177-Chlamydomonas_euryale.AAC.4